MPRPLPRLLPLVCAATLAATLGGGLLCASRALAQPAASAPGLKAGGALPAAAQPSSAVIEARTRAAAERILVALRNGDADTRYRQFAPSLQRMTSPTMIRQRINAMPKVLRWTLGAVVPGQDSSTITAHLITSAGPRELEMVIDADGLLEGYHFDAADQPAETVARQFVDLLGQGRYISAASFLSAGMQAEIRPSDLQIKWQRLQRLTGDYVAIRQVFRSEASGDQKLVLVRTEFRRITDNLYVILDGRNQVIGVDFPIEPNAPAPSR